MPNKGDKVAHPIRIAVISAATFAFSIHVLMGQAPAAPPAPPSPGTQTSVPISAQLQPALTAVHNAVDSVRVDKWKRGGIRDEAAKNISEIQRDIDVSLPPLLRDADSAPGALSKSLPVSRNISALYDVLLRVVEASRVIGPDDQVATLQQALVTLGNARLSFGDRMLNTALASEKQIADLHATVQSQAAKIAATPTPVSVPCTPTPSHTTTKKTTRKPAAKPSNAAPATIPQAKPGAGTPAQPH
jgi:hypothetical protein